MKNSLLILIIILLLLVIYRIDLIMFKIEMLYKLTSSTVQCLVEDDAGNYKLTDGICPEEGE